MSERLQTLYRNKTIPEFTKELGYKNAYQVPNLYKIVINRGLGVQDSENLDIALRELSLISGQKGVMTRSKKSIATFKLKAQAPVGVSVILRDKVMYAFLDRLISLALPRIRDFRGISPKQFDECGNYCVGLDEQLMFPEIHYDLVKKVRGMDIAIVTTAKTDSEGWRLLKSLGLPF